ncbi:MAG TPA: nitroreductase family protein [Candidatus Lokiarchaeia archaeon]|nr:nitroreductase family protein [Candidatus Lokiarchaeia archaeon]
MTTPQSDAILENIKERHSSRTPFDTNQAISSEDLLQVLEAARWTPTAHNMQNFEIIVVDDHEKLETLSKISSPISEVFIRENYAQLSFSEEELRAKKTGILGTFFPEFMQHPDAPRDEGETEEMDNQAGLINASSMFLVVVFDPSKRAPASEGDFLGIMSLGCLMENMWLVAQSLGLAFHIVSDLVDDPAQSEARTILGIPEDLRIAFTARLGYPLYPEDSLRVRRDIEDFVHRNTYNIKGIE